MLRSAFYRGPYIFDITRYGALGDNVADCSSAIIRAATDANALAAKGINTILYAPAGYYLVKNPPDTFTRPVSVIGDGCLKTIFRIDPTLSGDLFSWSECWYGNSFVSNPPTIVGQKANTEISNFSIVGDRTASAQQNALMFYDRSDALFINNISIDFLKGKALSFGLLKNSTVAFLRESRIVGFRANECGDASIPTVEFGAQGTGDTTNQLRIFDFNIFAPHGPGLVFTNKVSGKGVGVIYCYGLRIEGSGAISPEPTEDLFVIGDLTTTDGGGINNLNIYGLRLTAPYTGQHALTMQASNSTVGLKNYNISIHDLTCGPGPGGGLNIQAGRLSRFGINIMTVTGTGITVGPSSNGIGSLTFDGLGDEANWTWNVDSSSMSSIRVPIARWGNPVQLGVMQVA